MTKPKHILNFGAAVLMLIGVFFQTASSAEIRNASEALRFDLIGLNQISPPTLPVESWGQIALGTQASLGIPITIWGRLTNISSTDLVLEGLDINGSLTLDQLASDFLNYQTDADFVFQGASLGHAALYASQMVPPHVFSPSVTFIDLDPGTPLVNTVLGAGMRKSLAPNQSLDFQFLKINSDNPLPDWYMDQNDFDLAQLLLVVLDPRLHVLVPNSEGRIASPCPGCGVGAFTSDLESSDDFVVKFAAPVPVPPAATMFLPGLLAVRLLAKKRRSPSESIA